ncbi:MAG: hypothetical protein ACOVO2_07770 [Emticicia sp.]|uniref:hypothetical protein n=1 Tax=Emticicia sp. TaxID=1930953 RepID=UPI003BA6C7A2
MRKKVFDKIYFVLLLVTIFSSSCTMLLDMASKDGISGSDTDIELLEDGNSMTDSGETNIEQVNESLIEQIISFNFCRFLPLFNAFSYLQNTYEIYLGHNTPPPK